MYFSIDGSRLLATNVCTCAPKETNTLGQLYGLKSTAINVQIYEHMSAFVVQTSATRFCIPTLGYGAVKQVDIYQQPVALLDGQSAAAVLMCHANVQTVREPGSSLFSLKFLNAGNNSS